MKNAAYFIILILLSLYRTVSYAQTCPSFTVTLSSTGGTCLGASLNITSANTPSKIEWYNGSTLMGTAIPALTGVTIAGGNGYGSAPNQLNYPEGVFVDDAGSVFVSEHSNNRIQKWVPGATSGITVAGGNGPGFGDNQFNAPIGIFVDKNQNIYVSDPNNYRVQKWAPGATSGITVAGGNGQGYNDNQFLNPTDVFVDAQKNIYVVDNIAHRIQKWTEGAKTGITIIGSDGVGSGPNQLSSPTGIFVDHNGNIYISDQDNHRVQKWAPGATSGVTVAGGNGAGGAPNQLNRPYDVFVDGNGNVYVSDFNNCRVQKWIPGATAGITVAGGNGQGTYDYQIGTAFNIFVDKNENVYIADAYNSRVQKWGQTSAVNTKYIPTTAGSYSAVVTDGAGCSVKTNTIVIGSDLTPAINITITSGSQTNCAGTSVTFTATPTNGGSTPVYQWRVNGNNKGTNSPVFTSSTLANGDIVSCEMTGSASCTTNPTAISNNIPITITPAPLVVLGNNIVLDMGKNIQLNTSVTGNVVSYLWTPSTGLNNTTIPNPIASPLVTTTYKLEIKSANNCSSTAEITVTVLTDILTDITIPNVFSPNGDGINDVWAINNLQFYPNCRVDIYNRYGQPVFHSIGYSNPWEGTFNGKPLPLDAYFYVIDPKKGQKRISGNITILR